MLKKDVMNYGYEFIYNTLNKVIENKNGNYTINHNSDKEKQYIELFNKDSGNYISIDLFINDNRQFNFNINYIHGNNENAIVKVIKDVYTLKQFIVKYL